MGQQNVRGNLGEEFWKGLPKRVRGIHDLAMAARYCDELIAIGEGSIAAMGPAREVVTKDLIDRLYQTSVDILHAPGDGGQRLVRNDTDV